MGDKHALVYLKVIRGIVKGDVNMLTLAQCSKVTEHGLETSGWRSQYQSRQVLSGGRTLAWGRDSARRSASHVL